MSTYGATLDTRDHHKDPAFQLAPSEGEGPDMTALLQAFTVTVADNQPFVDQCRLNYETRYAIWNGQSADGKKHSRESSGKADPTPWDGASDLRVYEVDKVINYKIARYGLALRKAHLIAQPVNGNDIERAQVVSDFMQWVIHTQIEDLDRERELLDNYLLEKGVALMGVFWENKQEKTLVTLKLEDLQAKVPNIDWEEAVKQPRLTDKFLAVLEEVFGVSAAKARQMLSEFRRTGETSAPVEGREISRPVVRAFCLDRDVFVPSWATDLETAPYIFRVEYYPAEQLRMFANTEGWDADWVEAAIEKCRGRMITTVPDSTLQPISRSFVYIDRKVMYTDLIGVVFAYRRLSDEDGVPGVYLTIFNPFLGEKSANSTQKKESGYVDIPDCAKHGLLGYKDGGYPFVKFAREYLSRKFHDTRGLPEPGKSWQDQIKAHRDSRIDAASLAILPPLMYPSGRPPTRWGPGSRVPERRLGEYHHADRPMGDVNTENSEKILVQTFNEYNGILNPELDDPTIAAAISQNDIDRYIGAWSKVYRKTWKRWQQYGDQKTMFRVIGLQSAPPQVIQKGDPTEDFEFFLSFDVLGLDPEWAEKKIEMMAKTAQTLDRNGQVDYSKFLVIAMNTIDPVITESVVRPAQAGIQDVVANVLGDLTQIYAGVDKSIKLGTPSQLGLQVIQGWMQQPDVQQRYAGDEAFRGRVDKYAKQLQFQQTQQQNAVIGKYGA